MIGRGEELPEAVREGDQPEITRLRAAMFVRDERKVESETDMSRQSDLYPLELFFWLSRDME